ncbi:hypothetical protein, partial [Staphylococcus aureus]|uniref:hypothetical protein n=1 Tax=Staphylococcus aureus TaxID=1280 RepID=UPI0039BEAC8C
YGIQVTDPASQLRSALQTIETRLDNEIRDIEFELATGKKIVKTKTAAPSNPEIDAKRARLVELRRQRIEVFGDPSMTPENRLRRALQIAQSN